MGKRSISKTHEHTIEPIDGSSYDLKIKSGDMLLLHVPSNPSTGYIWNTSIEGDTLKSYRRTYSSRDLNLQHIGGGGIEHFKFKATKPGNAKITIVHNRPWMPWVDSKTVTILVVVQ